MYRLSTMVFLGMTGVALAQGGSSPAIGPSGATGQVLRSHVTSEQSIKAEGTVESIDRQLRALVIHWDDGSYSTFRAPRVMRNFNNVRLGDVVEVEFQEASVLSLVRGGTVPSGSGSHLSRAHRDERPHGENVYVTQQVATVQQIDAATRQVVLRNDETGNVRTVNVPPSVSLDGVNVGDKVVVTSGESILVDVRPSPTRGRQAPR